MAQYFSQLTPRPASALAPPGMDPGGIGRGPLILADSSARDRPGGMAMFARSSVDVTFKDADVSRIPDALTEGALLLLDLRRRGVVDDVGRRLKIRRQGGFSGVDVWAVLMLYLAMGGEVGVRRFWELSRPHVLSLAALAGRRGLPSPASLSRALDAVESELLREQASWLLVETTGVDALLRHPSAKTYDARGDGWDVFDLDPTVKTLRHRSLPFGDDLPEAMRDSADCAAPGHAGRKRGDVQFRRMTVQHAGSSAWLHAHLSPGNGDGMADFEPAVDTISATCDRLGVPRSRALVRMDGEHGHVPWFAACRARRLPFVTRLNRPKLLHDVDVLERLRTATWSYVPDSGSGPRRSAADLGVLTVHPDRRTKRPDGTSYEPVTVRVVASRYPRDRAANRGRVLDGWQVELFAVDVDPAAWSAADAVAQFFGRAGQENRFAQEDRELGLDRIVSYHLPGQELATLVGLSLWNLRLARGFELNPPPDVRPAQRLRRPQRDDRAPASWPSDPVLGDTLAGLDWSVLLAKRPGWSFDAAARQLRCEDGRALVLTTVRKEPHAKDRTGVIFCRPHGGCEDCASRESCLRSGRRPASKHVELSIASDVADRLRERLALVRGEAEHVGGPAIEPITTTPGCLEVAEPMFLPARARQGFQELFRTVTLHVEVMLPTPEQPRPVLVAADVSDRRRRRKTWEQNVARYALPRGARVRLTVEAPAEVRQLLGEAESL
jgi:hypothetical protein